MLEWVLFGISIFVSLILLNWIIKTYNLLVFKKNRVLTAESQIKVNMKKRFNLLDNLVETIKGYAGHEKNTLEEVTKARTALEKAGTDKPDENLLTSTFKSLFALAEQYPNLKAQLSFGEFQKQLVELEKDIAFTRGQFNEIVFDYNNTVNQFPSNAVAKLFGFFPFDWFDNEKPELEKIEFGVNR